MRGWSWQGGGVHLTGGAVHTVLGDTSFHNGDQPHSRMPSDVSSQSAANTSMAATQRPTVRVEDVARFQSMRLTELAQLAMIAAGSSQQRDAREPGDRHG